MPLNLCNSALVLLYRKVKVSLSLKIDPVTVYSYVACCHEGGKCGWCSDIVQVLFVSDKKCVLFTLFSRRTKYPTLIFKEMYHFVYLVYGVVN